MKTTKGRIVLGMSGGVDSSVCAYLLQKQGYEVIGLFMQNWDSYLNNDFLGNVNESKQTCNVQKDFNDAKLVADKLGIKIYRINFIEKYWNKVFKYLIAEYKKGRTPNPDVLCNKYIKFNEFIKYAAKKFKCNKIAMGHYANVKKVKNQYYLTKARDQNKDQTYFLCWLNQDQLSKTIFPIGNIPKDEVRKIAHEQGLINWDKKDSTGICFIGERKFKEFLNNYIPIKKGKVIDIVTNKTVGNHDGIMFYTIGQNKNLGLGGKTNKYFVCKKDFKNNIVYVVDSISKDKYLSSIKCEVEKFNWINENPKSSDKVQIRFRHRQELVDGKYEIKNNKVILSYKSTLSVAPGQFAVLYKKDICLGGGIVSKTM